MTVVPLNNANAATTVSATEQSVLAQTVSMQAGGDSTKLIRGNIDLRSLNGTSASEFSSDDRFQAAFGANPVEVQNLHVIYENPSGTTVGSAYMHYWIEYTCELFDPIELAQS